MSAQAHTYVILFWLVVQAPEAIVYQLQHSFDGSTFTPRFAFALPAHASPMTRCMDLQWTNYTQDCEQCGWEGGRDQAERGRGCSTSCMICA
jgi:hypothetical protein